MAQAPIDVPLLQLDAVIGFNGKVPAGLIIHPDKQHIIYPLGSTVIVEDLSTHKQQFLSGHSNDVTCITVSKSGQYIASGQVTYMGYKADIIVWDYSTKEIYAKFILHKVKIEDLSFSFNECYLASLGGLDDGSVVIWDLQRKEAICGSPAQYQSAGVTYRVKFLHKTDEYFVTAGQNTMRIWQLDRFNRKILSTDVKMGKLKRIIKCVDIEEDDSFCYCGTTSGDILAVNLQSKMFQVIGPKKGCYSQGVLSLVLLVTGQILVGAGDGTLALIRGMRDEFKPVKDKTKILDGEVTSIVLRGQGHQFFVGTSKGNMYRFNFAEFTHELLATAHYHRITDIKFPRGGRPEDSELFATSSEENVRIWHLATCQELLRICIPNMLCNCLEFFPDGKSILSGWQDGKIRSFYPKSGKVMYIIHDAHIKGVTALAVTSDGQRILSGGGEGQVRIWMVQLTSSEKGPVYTTRLVEALKEHKGAVTCIQVTKSDRECVSSSSDGTCIIWDLGRFVRNQVMFANTLFQAVAYRPDECQIVTVGTDRKIGYWETFDGTLIRELEGSKSGSINGLDVDAEGKFLVTGGDDRLIKVWTYNEGEVIRVGLGHSDAVTRVRISPNRKHIVSVSNDGAILRWRFPDPASTSAN